MLPSINIYLKLALIVVGIVAGFGLTFAYGFWYGFPFFLMALILLISYFLLGTVQSASALVEQGDFAGAKKRLSFTKFPRFLYVSNRASYYILHGSIESQAGNNKAADAYFQEALSLDLPTDNEKAMIYLQLANVNATRNNWTATTNYFKKAKSLNVTMPQLKNQLDMFEQAVKQRGNAKLAQQSIGRGGKSMMGGRSSKRRRPKMR